MDNERSPKRVLRRLGEEETIKSFNCGDADLNDFLFNEAPLYAKALLAITYVYDDTESILAYFSLANDRISLSDFEKKTEFNRFRRHRFVNAKRIKSYPAVKICRLGVSENCKGEGVGSGLLDVIKDFVTVSNKIGCRFLTVDAYREAIPFYIRNGFIPLEEEDKDEHTRLLFYDLKEE
ncbi:GNAT family N-acetyltransferase [Parabacteroides gordonii]|uniref:GNAT family N-acetyltransferase n=1 Tax=Parabacteroides gordonii TaxID=574930 RepID=UPI0026F0BB98|nr:GNAT family N-acetyltransferase [Parabacteroides gordonii]